jgi:hypothetical protein
MNNLLVILIPSLILLTTLVIIIIIHIANNHNNTANKGNKDKPKMYSCKNGKCVETKDGKFENENCESTCQEFQKVVGVSGDSGLCRTTGDNFPYFSQTTVTSQLDCENLCKDDTDCVAYNYNTKDNICQIYSMTAKNNYTPNPSDGWKNTYKFPLYPSPYYCVSPIPKDSSKCHSLYGDESVCGAADNWVCYGRKSTLPFHSWNEKDIDCSKYNTCTGNDKHGIYTIISNPYIPTSLLLKTPGNFYYWFYNLINNASSYCYIINTYWKLAQLMSNDLDDYQTRIYYSVLNKLKQGVTFYIVHSGQGDDTCTVSFGKQKKFVDYFQEWNSSNINTFSEENAKGKLNIISTKNTKIGFFHDKIYLNNNECYIGGQNMSGISSIDFGVRIPAKTPLYDDLLSRCIYFKLLGNNKLLNFKTNANSPYIPDTENGSKYYIAISPVWPECKAVSSSDHGCKYGKQTECNYSNKDIGIFKNSLGNVSFEWYHLNNIFKNAKKWIFVTNYEISPYSQFYSMKGSSFTMFNSLLSSSKNMQKNNILPGYDNTTGQFSGVQLYIDAAVHYSPDNSVCQGVTNCEFLRCERSRQWLEDMKNAGANINWWYEDPRKSAKPDFGKNWMCNLDDFNCKLLHAKIFYSDYGLLITSSNFTNSYFAGTENTGLCVVFGENGPPQWVVDGMKNIKSVFDKNASKCVNINKPNIITPEDPSVDQLCHTAGNTSYCCACFVNEKNIYNCDA